MAASKQQVQSAPTTPVPLTDEEALAREYAGAGISNKAADNIVPQLTILQPMSPEIVDGKIPNAKAGDFLMGSTVIPGQEGIWYQPAHWDQRWLEFRPLNAGGGFVAAYEWRGEQGTRPIPPEGAKTVDEFHFKMGDNELVHYRQWAGLAWVNQSPLERVINFKSTGHTIARQWNNTAREANRFSDGTQRPLFMHVYKLTTERVTNAKGTWHQLVVGHPVLLTWDEDKNKEAVEKARSIVGPNVHAAVTLGAKLFTAFKGGELRAEVDAADQRQPQPSDAF